MVLCLNDIHDKMTVVKLADCVSEDQALVFLHSLDFENLYSASLCQDNGIIIYKISLS